VSEEVLGSACGAAHMIYMIEMDLAEGDEE
jgi:hypothetical protein